VSQTPIIISYHTDDEIYRPAAERLRASLEKFGLEHEIVCCAKRGTWTENCRYKAKFIHGMLWAYRPLDLIWMDADAEVLQYPEMLSKIDADLAAVVNSHGIFASLIYFQNTPEVMKLVRDWIEANDEYPNEFTGDQANLVRVLAQHPEIKFKELPGKYSYNPDIMDNIGNPVIYQHQASRQGRNFYGVTA
jgi:hypothetical protein